MIILGTYDFAMGMKLAGVRNSHVIKSKSDFISLKSTIAATELIIASESVFRIVPELEKFQNLVILPDNPSELLESADLKKIIKSAVGVELKI
jgi:vacuolar-type H+-ATPase subunit F/Vma7